MYTWDLFSAPSRDGTESTWSRRASRQILLDLSIYDIFDCDDPCLGTLHISKNYLALYLPCCDVLLIFDLSQSNNIQLEALRLDQEFVGFMGYHVVDNSHYFVFNEEDGDDKWTSIYLKCGDVLNLYTRIDHPTNTNSIVFHELKITIPSATDEICFYQIQLDVEDIIDRQVHIC